MSDLREEVFGSNTTLWHVLNTQGVPELAEQTRQIKQQLDSLALTVQNYQSDTNAEVLRLNSQIQDLNTQLSVVNLDITSLKDEGIRLGGEVTQLSNNLTSITDSLTTISQDVALLKITVEALRVSVVNNNNEVATLNNRVDAIERNSTDHWVRWGQRYSVMEWPNWSGNHFAYEIVFAQGTGYVPLNRVVHYTLGGSARTGVFGIAYREIPPNTGSTPAPLMEGLASFQSGSATALIYINKTVQ